jgi:hypothetical protein
MKQNWEQEAHTLFLWLPTLYDFWVLWWSLKNPSVALQALTNLGRLSSRRRQSFPTAPDGTGLTSGQHIESHSCIFRTYPIKYFVNVNWIEQVLKWPHLTSFFNHGNEPSVLRQRRYLRRSQQPRGLRRRHWWLGRWDRGFESRLRHGCLSSSVMVSCATSWSLVQSGPTKCLNVLRNLPCVKRPRSF